MFEKIEYVDLKYKPNDELIAEYWVEPNGISIKKACENIATESSIGTWTTISTMSPSIARKLKPHVYYIKKSGNGAYIKIAYNQELFEEGNVPEILSSIAGNIFGMKALKNLRLLDIRFPKKILRSFKGPQFGVNGVRKLLKVYKRPLVGTIVKPKVGLTAKQHAKVAYDAWVGGLDVVKDDENLTSMKFNKFKERIKETLKMRDKAEKETGERKMYMPNTTAETLEMLKRADYVKKNGGEYAMIDIITAGFSALQTLRNHMEKNKQVIHAHRAMHAAFTRNKRHGITMLVISKLSRLIGVDQLHIGTIVGKMAGQKLDVEETEDEIEEGLVTKQGHILEQKWYNIKPIFAVASGGLQPGHVPKVIKYLGKNVIMQFGGGCHGHPDGTVAGAKAIRQAVDATMKGIKLEEYAKKHKELRMALEKWGKVK